GSSSNAKLQIDTDGTTNGINWTTIAFLDGVHLGDGVNVIVSGSTPAGVTIPVTAAPTESFDGDSHADILWQNANGTTAIWLMNGTNVVASGLPLPNPGPAWHTRAAGDFDGDGRADILWQNDNGTPAVWLMNGVNLASTSGPTAIWLMN